MKLSKFMPTVCKCTNVLREIHAIFLFVRCFIRHYYNGYYYNHVMPVMALNSKHEFYLRTIFLIQYFNSILQLCQISIIFTWQSRLFVRMIICMGVGPLIIFDHFLWREIKIGEILYYIWGVKHIAWYHLLFEYTRKTLIVYINFKVRL